MKSLAWLIGASLVANLVLGGSWIARRGASAQHAPAGVSSGSQPSHAVSNVRSSAGDTLGQPVAVVPTAVTWNDLETPDLKEFIRKLRAVGCPEETIQDLVLARLNRQFAARTRELWPDRYKNKPFWESSRHNDQQEVKRNRETMRKERELRKEKSAMLVELLGVDPEKERRKASGMEDYTDWQMSRIAFVPESKREAVSKFLDEFEDKMQDFYARNRGLYDSQYRAEQRQLEAERLQGLAQFLSPSEVREYELRQSQLATQLSFDLRGLSLSREQYVSIFDIRKKYGDSIHNFGDVESAEGRKEVEKTQKAMKDEIAAALGADFAKQYERSQDYAFRQLTTLTKRNDLAAEIPGKVYDFKVASEQSVKQIRENADLTADQRQKALQQIQTETEKAVKEALGEKVYKSYLRQGGWWINNINPNNRSPRDFRFE